MANLRALILAAGRGSRLGESGDAVPKPLLEIGRRRLIEHQLDALADAGIGPVHMVIGYGSDEIREIVGRRAEFVVNTRWEATNSLYSFRLGKEQVDGDMLLLNCDVLFSPQILERLLDHPGSALAIDSSSGTAREQMKVRLEGGRVVGMSKDLPVEDSSGENVGIIKLTADDAAMALDHARRLLDDGHEKSWVGSAIAQLARERDLRTVDVAGLPWVEIDFPVDLAKARKEVWPAIRDNTHRKQRTWRIAGVVFGAAVVIGATALAARYTAPPPPPPVDWETVLLESPEEILVTLGDRYQSWWMLDGNGHGALTVPVTGPGPVRVESRFLDPTGDRTPYVLEVALDGERVDWYKLNARPSGKATHPTWTISSKKRITLDVPEGRHDLRVRVVAPANAECLVRVRHIVDEATEDDDPPSDTLTP